MFSETVVLDIDKSRWTFCQCGSWGRKGVASWHRSTQSQLGSSEYLSRQRRFATTIGSAPQHDRYIHDRIVLRNRETLSAAGRRSRNYLQRLGVALLSWRCKTLSTVVKLSTDLTGRSRVMIDARSGVFRTGQHIAGMKRSFDDLKDLKYREQERVERRQTV